MGDTLQCLKGRGMNYKLKTFPKIVGVAGTLNYGGEDRGTLYTPQDREQNLMDHKAGDWGRWCCALMEESGNCLFSRKNQMAFLA